MDRPPRERPTPLRPPPRPPLPRHRPLRLEGTRDDSVVYYFEGYTYHADSRNHKTLRCSQRSHRCYKILYLDDFGRICDESDNDHECGNYDALFVRKYEFRQACILQAGTTLTGFKKIFKDLTVDKVGEPPAP